MVKRPTLMPDKITSTVEFEWEPVGFIERLPSGRHKYPSDHRLRGGGTYRLHAGGWPRQGDEWPECWYFGMSSTSMRERITRHALEQGVPHVAGPKPFRWILANGGWVAVWIGAALRINGVDENWLDRSLVGRGAEGAAILSNFGYIGSLNKQY